MTEFEKAIQYVRDNKTWSDEEEKTPRDYVEMCNCPITAIAPPIADEIHDLMEEYSAENDLPEGWWYEFGDEDDIFAML